MAAEMADGQGLDTSVGNKGLVTTSFPATSAGVALQLDGKSDQKNDIVVGGSSLERFTSTGAVDQGFGGDGTGLVTTKIGNNKTTFSSVAVQTSDGKIVVAGEVFDKSGNSPSTVIARFIGESPDITKLSPSTTATSSTSLTLNVTGDDFFSGSKVLWNGTTLGTTYVISTKLTAIVPSGRPHQAGHRKHHCQQQRRQQHLVDPADIYCHWLDRADDHLGHARRHHRRHAAERRTAKRCRFRAGRFQVFSKHRRDPGAGLGQVLSVTFTPKDTIDYKSATAQVSINVLARPHVTKICAAAKQKKA